VRTTTWVRLAPQPWSAAAADEPWVRPWLSERLADTSPDVLAVATEYLHDSPTALGPDGVQVAGNASFGPEIGENLRDIGSDFYDYLGVPWEFADGVRKAPEADQFQALDCSGYVRVVLGYRLGFPLLGGAGTGPGLPRRANDMATTGPGTDIIADRGTRPAALDGLQPDRGHEVLWVIRDCLSGEVLLARSLLSATQGDLVALLREVKQGLPVPVRGIISDGQETIRTAVAAVFPGVPHQLCQFHYLREAAKPVFEADRHAKKELQKQVRGVRPLERALEGRTDPEATAIRGYCLAVRSAITDDGRPPLSAPGLRLHDRLTAIVASIDRVAEKGGSPSPWPICVWSCSAGWTRRRSSGRRCVKPTGGSIRPRTSSRMRNSRTGRGCGTSTSSSSRR